MKRGVVVSDLHCGSYYGLLPPDFVTFDDVPKLQNIRQKFLWDCWRHFCGTVRRFKPDFIINNSDTIDGPQKKNEGSELSLHSPKDQARAAIAVLQLLRDAAPRAAWYSTRGTPYHVGHWGDAEEAVAEAIGSLPYASVDPGKLCHSILRLEVEGVIIDAAHHVGGGPVNRLMGIEREVREAILAAARHKIAKPDLVIRAHRHTYAPFDDGITQGFVGPCWKLQDEYARKPGAYRFMPDIGAMRVTVDGSLKKRGKAACTWEAELYDLPPLPITTLAA